jgi:hypothetical protein
MFFNQHSCVLPAANEDARGALLAMLGAWLARLNPLGSHGPVAEAAAAGLAEGVRSSSEVLRRNSLRAAAQVRLCGGKLW